MRTLSQDTINQIGQEVTLKGWVNNSRDHGGLIFIDLRDHTGLVQLTIHPEQAEAFAVAGDIHDEYVIQATGKVVSRDAGLVNDNIPTGAIEVIVSELIVLNKSETLPFPVSHGTEEVNEELRLKYRFLDLRRPKMQDRLKRRDAFNMAIRSYMHAQDFTEITTPILASSSPEGARDYLVPSRLHPGQFYALPQAPQQFKQLLMVGGVSKYFQIAPCFRDEDPRADRHPGEFYQLDLEMSFVEKGEDVLQTVEPLIVSLVTEFAGKELVSTDIPRIPHAESMEKYGSDKPDLRFGMEMVDLTTDLTNTEFTVFASAIKNGGAVKALCGQGGATITRSQIDELTELAKRDGAGGLAYIQMAEDGPKSPILKFLSEAELAAVIEKTGAKTGDIIFFGADDRATVNKVLGNLRSTLGDWFNLKDPNKVALAWIIDFPLYEHSEIDGKVDFGHNPFSMPVGGMAALDNPNPLEIKADQYDMVANGYEICSGAIRNFNPEVMYKAFGIVGISTEQVDEKFGAMIKAFKFGAPPHGGCAFGLDRLFMILEDEPNIREVIAFPKNGSAIDLLMQAPSNVDEKQLKDLHIKLDLPKK
ncbi:MAG TPA: aspartate--tRNA ligase [Patescibacteria group bacterium]|jgi:aspartyl-tRNA synthetase|nr:aspartate--tRNA ligase [Patescibacteria group bacterium]